MKDAQAGEDRGMKKLPFKLAECNFCGAQRAICFFRRLMRSADYASRVFGYLGVRPDPNSTFMRSHFKELLDS